MRLIILDRDGVINETADGPVTSVHEWRPLPGSLEAIARLTQAHYHVVIITHQPGLSRGLFDLDDLNQIHVRMRQVLAQQGGRIEAIYYCPHDANDDCHCRQPKVGLLRDLAKRLKINLTDVPAIGGSWANIQAAQAVKARPILVRTGRSHVSEEQHGKDFAKVDIFDDLAAVVDQLLQQPA